MRIKNHKSTDPGFLKIFSVVLMFFCISFLTGLNFFVYPNNTDEQELIAQQADDQEESKTPQAPEEEKSSNTNNNTSIQEEYIHERHGHDEMAYLEKVIHDKILEAEKLEVVHYDLFCPPPEA